MPPWPQTYDPLGNVLLSTLAAALPVIALLGTIAFLKVRIHFAALIGLALAAAIAIGIYRMPSDMTGAAALYGMAFGLFPIGWMLLNIIFLYQLTVKRGLFAILRDSLAGIAPDPRIQVILIAFAFGAFLEGMAGFGAPVAITAAILIQLGFRPLHASGLALIANTAPVAFGSLGIPITTLEQVTGLDVRLVSAMVGRQLPFFSFLIPFWVVAAFSGWRGMLGIWPAALTAGLAFAVPQFLVSNYHGPWLVDLVSGGSAIAATILLLRFWKPRELWGFDAEGVARPAADCGLRIVDCGLSEDSRDSGKIPPRTDCGLPLGGLGALSLSKRPIADGGLAEDAPDSGRVVTDADCALSEDTRIAGRTPTPRHHASQVFRAWMPWAILTAFILCWGTPQWKTALDRIWLQKFEMPHLHMAVQRMPPISPQAAPEPAEFKLNALSATGTGILLAALVAGFTMRFSPAALLKTYAETLWRVRYSLLTIALMLALGNVTKYSGTDATLGLALARTGTLYPFFGTLLGWLGVALTGSDTASNVLFGSLQKITAHQLGISPVLMGAANSSGGVMGKMVDAQSIVVASTATNWYGHEGDILRYVLFHSLALAALVGILVYCQAYIAPFTQMVP